MGRSSADPGTTVEAATEALHTLHSTALGPKTFARGLKLQLMLGQAAMRAMAHGLTTAAVLPLRPEPQTLNELMALQQAVIQRIADQQKGWLEGCAALAEERNRIKEANTLSKFVEQEYNLFANFSALVADQMSQWAGLVENTQVDYGYWIAQQAQQEAGQAQLAMA
jgi:hypothetical protein